MTLCFFLKTLFLEVEELKRHQHIKIKGKEKNFFSKVKKKTLKKIESTEVDGWLCRGEKAKSSVTPGHDQEIT